jgi:hypothetical protein
MTLMQAFLSLQTGAHFSSLPFPSDALFCLAGYAPFSGFTQLVKLQ